MQNKFKKDESPSFLLVMKLHSSCGYIDINCNNVRKI